MAPSLQRNKLIWLLATAVISAAPHVWQKRQAHQRNVCISDVVPTGSSSPLLSIVCAADSSLGTSDTLICFTLCSRMVALEDLCNENALFRIACWKQCVVCTIFSKRQMLRLFLNQRCIFNHAGTVHVVCYWPSCVLSPMLVALTVRQM